MNKSTASTTSMAPRRQVPSSCAPSDPQCLHAPPQPEPVPGTCRLHFDPDADVVAQCRSRGQGHPRALVNGAKIARKLAENASYIPRPKNSFILFRTDFVARRSGADAVNGGRGGSTGGDGEESEEEAGSSLSKQASAVWNKMSAVEKQPWVERAEHEKRSTRQSTQTTATVPYARVRAERLGRQVDERNVQQASRRTSPETIEIKQEAADSRNTVGSRPSQSGVPRRTTLECVTFS
ncbi:hypothetical protein DFH11DRAFT_247308 [Phellopilus nigrolimitatus]|nr:hypothetical protein DFH11DRAFT_247308 [Phellopilus nigrolimitatus]